MATVRVITRLALTVALVTAVMAQTPPARKRLLVIGEEKGYRHEAVTHAMVTIERLGRETGGWDTVIRTDTEALTKAKLEYNAKTLNDFDAVLFYTGGTLEMDDQKKADFHFCALLAGPGGIRHARDRSQFAPSRTTVVGRGGPGGSAVLRSREARTALKRIPRVAKIQTAEQRAVVRANKKRAAHGRAWLVTESGGKAIAT